MEIINRNVLASFVKEIIDKEIGQRDINKIWDRLNAMQQEIIVLQTAISDLKSVM